MRLAVLSDIHSNVFALAAVLDDIARQKVDIRVNLGDILYGPIAPKATYDLLQQHDFITICGNQDRQIFQATAQEIASNPTMEFILKDLGQEPLSWMKSLPFDKQLTDKIYLCHGTPSDDLIYLLEDISTGAAVLREDTQIISLLKQQPSSLVLCGHTHTPRAVTLSTNQLVVNPGSVGLQAYTDSEPVIHSMENYSPHANYAIIEQNNNGWIVEQRRVPYDVAAAVRACKLRDRHDWVHFLTTGRKQ